MSSSDTFVASVQYNDGKGTSSADRADSGDAESWLEANGYKTSDEFLVGITMFAGESAGKHEDPVYVTFLLTSPRDHDEVKLKIDSSKAPLAVRRVCVEMKLAQFFGLFKRFEVVISSHGMLDGREYTFTD